MSTTLWIIGAVILIALLVSGLGWLAWRRITDADRRLLKRISRLPLHSKFALAWRLYRDRRVPAGLRLIPPLLVLYLAMPLDIVPDFIPVIGQLDDALIIIAAVTLLFRFMNRDVLVQHLEDLELEAAGVDDTAIEGGPLQDP
jgi:uncharacterized membrane protein YkvA (DUF1232 family)